MKEALVPSPVLDVAARLMTPFILLFAAYVVAHGHSSPGGGFQGGVILAAAIILARLTRGPGDSFGPGRGATVALACAGVLVYAGIGALSPLLSAAFLDYSVLPVPGEPGAVRAVGSFGIEIGVAISVTAVMVLLFDVLTGGAQEP